MKIGAAIATGGESLVYQHAAKHGLGPQQTDRMLGWNQPSAGAGGNGGGTGANTGNHGATLGGGPPGAPDTAGAPPSPAAPSYAMQKYGIPDTHPVAGPMNRYALLAGDNADPQADQLLAAVYAP